MSRAEIITPQSHPDHHTVGRRFSGWDGNTYFCDSYDPSCGYWMTDETNPANRRNISERAVGRTFHPISIYPLLGKLLRGLATPCPACGHDLLVRVVKVSEPEHINCSNADCRYHERLR
jgi:hypothetical protein